MAVKDRSCGWYLCFFDEKKIFGSTISSSYCVVCVLQIYHGFWLDFALFYVFSRYTWVGWEIYKGM